MPTFWYRFWYISLLKRLFIIVFPYWRFALWRLRRTRRRRWLIWHDRRVFKLVFIANYNPWWLFLYHSLYSLLWNSNGPDGSLLLEYWLTLFFQLSFLLNCLQNFGLCSMHNIYFFLFSFKRKLQICHSVWAATFLIAIFLLCLLQWQAVIQLYPVGCPSLNHDFSRRIFSLILLCDHQRVLKALRVKNWILKTIILGVKYILGSWGVLGALSRWLRIVVDWVDFSLLG